MPAWGTWLFCLALLFVRALVAAAEAALYGISDLRAAELAKTDPGAGGRVLRQKTERESTAASIRVGMVLLGFTAAALGALHPAWPPDLVGGELTASLLGVLAVGLVAALLDVSARAMASADPVGWALRLSGALRLVVLAFYPLMKVLMGTLNLIARPFGGRVRFEAPPPPLEELEKLLALRAGTEGLDAGAPQLIHSIFELSDKRCRDLMVPRTDAVCVESSTPPDDLLALLAEENHSRIPVYRDDVDHIIGILHARDLIPLLRHPDLIVLQDIVRPANFVPWMKPIGDLLREMQQEKIHMAIVVDEHGGFMGLVTLEDILREIVGDIGDEFEEEERLVERQPDGSLLVDGGTELEELEELIGFQAPEGDYETLGGLLSWSAGALPEVGDRFDVDGWQLQVMTKTGPRLERVRMTRVEAPELGVVEQPPKQDRGKQERGGATLARISHGRS